MFQNNETFPNGTDKYVNYTATLNELTYKINENFTAYNNADVVIGVTQRPMSVALDWDAKWTGAPTVGGACTKHKVGVIEDNALTFSGAPELAVQLAILLGATPEQHIYGESLLSSPRGEYYGLSARSANQIRHHSHRSLYVPFHCSLHNTAIFQG